MSTPSPSPDIAPAHALWVQLATRVTTQPLHYRSGEEETAAESIHSLCERARELLEEHPEAAEFRRVAVSLLNGVLRPYTARWHGWMTEDKERRGEDGKPVLRFRDGQVRRQFRKELRELRPRLVKVQNELARLAGIPPQSRHGKGVKAGLGEPLVAGIGHQVTFRTDPKDETRLTPPDVINASEHLAVLRRRVALGNCQDGDSPRSEAELVAAQACSARPPDHRSRGNDDATHSSEKTAAAPTSSAKTPEANAETKVQDAIGLALSGGGIRSATFCLGIVQVLARKGLLLDFDYLSTVSGGGYLGAFLSTALGTRQASSQWKLGSSRLGQSIAGIWGKVSQSGLAVSQLGQSMARTWKAVSQFIAPGLATVASGLLARKAKTPREFAEARVDDVFHRQDEPSRKQGIESGLVRHLRNHSRYLLEGGFLGKVRIAGLVLSGLAWNVMILLPVPLTAALLAWESGEWLWGEALQPGQFRFASLMTARAGQFLWAFGTVFCAFWVVLPGIQLLAHGKPPDSKRARLRRRWESSVLWLGLATVAVGALCLVPGLFHLHESLRTRLASEGVAGSHLGKLGGLLPTSVTGVAGAALAALAAWLTPRWPRLRALAARLLVLSGPLLLLFVFLLVANQMGLVRAPGDGVPWDPLRVFWVTLGLTTWAWVCVNINTLAPHRYYRDRLCECYLVRRTATEEGWWHRLVRSFTRKEAPGRTEVLQQVKLSSLGADPAAPYHLINMTVNVPTSGNKNLRGRGSDFCLASRHFYGSPLTGYGRTEELEKMDPHFDLGTAMAVSGAAASTAMGWKTLPHFRFLMALFNVRLGYWLRNPNRLARSWWVEGAGPWYLFREMLGRMDENCRYLNLSDGGHIENLAVYELLRRQCKFIVSVDAGQEPGMECADLIRLQRYAEIDLGIRLHFDTADLQIGPNGLSRAHAILVKIDYAPETAPGQQLGWLLYLKLAMTGVEPNYVTDYRRGNPDFPHQTTGDQIYDEAQFEAYRALGECAMEGMLREEIVGKRTPGTVRAWFQCLANNLLPDNDEAFR